MRRGSFMRKFHFARGLPTDGALRDPKRLVLFMAHVTFEPNTGCWLWTGAVQTASDYEVRGYAAFWNGDRTVLAHRWLWEFCNGPIPEGLALDHRCRQRSCVNPQHLEPVTPGENARRGQRWPHEERRAA